MGSTANQSQFNINNIATSLNEKAERDFVNITNLGRSRGAGWALPSNTYIDLAVGPSDTEYIAPANGYYAIQGVWGNTASWISLVNTSAGNICGYTQTGQAGATTGITYVPVKKDDLMVLQYYLISSFIFFRFVYAEGSEWEAQ